MSAHESVEITGHLMDHGILSRVLDDIREYGGDYAIERFDVGRETDDPSHAVITVTAEDGESLERLLMRLQTRGVNQVDPGEASVAETDRDGVFPDHFYSTTNLETRVRIEGAWLQVENPEMDCGLVLERSADGRPARVFTLPMSDVRRGMLVVTGASGVRVTVPAPDRTAGAFGFMESEVSSEKPQAVLVRQVADGMREAKAAGKKVLWVGGPGVVHTGAAPAMVALVHAGYVDVLFAGNALATHDIESALYGTSLGVDLAQGRGVEHGHEHHIRALNTIRKEGSIRAAVESGVLTSGIMHAMVTHEKTFVLVGSVRDDGPLPDVYTDVIEGQRAMRANLTDVGFCLMVATMLHSVATGNILPASVPLVCVDINPATVTKLADRGSSQARGIVTDVGLFLEQLAVGSCPSTGAPERLPGQLGGPDRPGLGAERRPDHGRDHAVRGTHERLAERGPGGFEQQVAGGRQPAADHDDLGIEGRHEVRDADAEPLPDRGGTPPARRRRPRWPPRSPSGRSAGPGRPRTPPRATSAARRSGPARSGPARSRWSTAPSIRCRRTRRPARPGPPACVRTRRPCRCGRGEPRRRGRPRRRCRCPSSPRARRRRCRPRRR